MEGGRDTGVRVESGTETEEAKTDEPFSAYVQCAILKNATGFA